MLLTWVTPFIQSNLFPKLIYLFFIPTALICRKVAKQRNLIQVQRTSKQTFKCFVLVKVPHFPLSTSGCGWWILDFRVANTWNDSKREKWLIDLNIHISESKAFPFLIGARKNQQTLTVHDAGDGLQLGASVKVQLEWCFIWPSPAMLCTKSIENAAWQWHVDSFCSFAAHLSRQKPIAVSASTCRATMLSGLSGSSGTNSSKMSFPETSNTFMTVGDSASIASTGNPNCAMRFSLTASSLHKTLRTVVVGGCSSSSASFSSAKFPPPSWGDYFYYTIYDMKKVHFALSSRMAPTRIRKRIKFGRKRDIVRFFWQPVGNSIFVSANLYHQMTSSLLLDETPIPQGVCTCYRRYVRLDPRWLSSASLGSCWQTDAVVLWEHGQGG